MIKVLITLILISQYLLSQQAEVTNVLAVQRTDGSKLVDITYDISEDALFSFFQVSVEISLDEGITYDALNRLSGDVGIGIAYGTNKHIIWDLEHEYEPLYTETSKFKVIAIGHYEAEPPFELVTVPAGEFTYGPSNEILSIDYNYEIMKYEVTNAQYVEFLLEAIESEYLYITDGNVSCFYIGDSLTNEGYYGIGLLERIEWNETTFIVEEGYGDHPVANITYYGANAFAEYYGFQIPSDKEWEKAARGNTGWTYPWDGGLEYRANYASSGDPFDDDTTPVGYYNGNDYDGYQTIDSPSVFGAYDMAGNVNDWTRSWGEGEYFPSRRTRGGSWDDLGTWPLCSYNWGHAQSDDFSSKRGFRCSRPTD